MSVTPAATLLVSGMQLWGGVQCKLTIYRAYYKQILLYLVVRTKRHWCMIITLIFRQPIYSSFELIADWDNKVKSSTCKTLMLLLKIHLLEFFGSDMWKSGGHDIPAKAFKSNGKIFIQPEWISLQQVTFASTLATFPTNIDERVSAGCSHPSLITHVRAMAEFNSHRMINCQSFKNLLKITVRKFLMKLWEKWTPPHMQDTNSLILQG